MKKHYSGIGPLFLSGASLLLIFIGIISAVYLPSAFQNQNFSTDVRKQASVQNGQVVITPTFQETPATNPTDKPQVNINLQVNTHGVQTDGIQLVFNVVVNAVDTLNVQVPSNSGLQAVHQEVQKTADGFLVSIIALPQNIAQPFSTNTDSTFLQLSFNPAADGTALITFDKDNSLSIVHASTPPDDELKILPQIRYNFVGPIALNTQVVPTPTPSPMPTPTPSPILSSIPGVRQCNESCSTNADCDVNLRCYYGQCRRATYVSSTTCAEAPDAGLQRQCNQYCADTNECASGYVCFYNACRLPSNPDSSTCTALSASTQQTIQNKCNASCNLNADCPVNMRCYNNQCRLASNPSSLSCSSPTAPTISSIYSSNNTVGGGPGTKGEEIPLPSASPSASSVPSASPLDLQTTLQPSASTSPAVEVLPTTAPNSGLMNFFNSLFANGASLPFFAMAAGAFLLLLAIVLFIFNRMRRSSSKPSDLTMMKKGFSPPQPLPPMTSTERKLEEKIAALKNQQPLSSSMTPPPSRLQTTATTMPPSSVAPVPVATLPRTAVPSATTASSLPPKPLTMAERLKQKGVFGPGSSAGSSAGSSSASTRPEPTSSK